VADKEETLSSGYRVIAVTWPFVAVIAVMLVISALSVVALSATRAYVAGNSHWTRAERETSVLLIAYMRTGDPESLAGLNTQMSIWSGDRSARLELLKSRPDYVLAHRGLLAGGNHTDDVPSMIWLFRAAKLCGVAEESVRIWADADELFSRYPALEQAAVVARVRGEPSAPQLDAWVQRVHLIHDPLAQLEQRFAASMEDYARRLAAFLLGFLIVSTAVLLTLSYVVSRRLVRRAGAMAAALRASERQVFAEQDRAQVLLRSISDAVISTDRHGTIEFLNAAAERLTGWTASEACGQALESVFRIAQTGHENATPMRQAIDSVLTDGAVRRLSHYGAELIRRDHSTAPVGERASPLRNRTGEIVGMVLVMRDVAPERQLWEQLRRQADHDALTGLPNRAQFERRLELAMQASADPGARFTVMFVDLDEFKAVNDTCGHRAGDELIRRIGACIQEQLRTDDLLARLGGDEFGLLLPACDISSASHTAERVRQAVEALQFDWEGKTFTVQASIGVVLDERALRSVGDVLSAADRACYAAKKAGRNCVRVYSGEEESSRWRAIDVRDPSA
jgi:diguanylate cyclase (GGDEF)-like protein/PAS domain S-box-containing protein